MRFGAHHEWGKLREAVIGISPAEDFVVFHEGSQRWLVPPGDTFSRQHAGSRLIDIDLVLKNGHGRVFHDLELATGIYSTL